MSKCVRCGDTVVHAGGDRFQLRAWDRSDSTISTLQGSLCVPCWDDLLQFITEDPCTTRWATA